MRGVLLGTVMMLRAVIPAEDPTLADRAEAGLRALAARLGCASVAVTRYVPEPGDVAARTVIMLNCSLPTGKATK